MQKELQNIIDIRLLAYYVASKLASDKDQDLKWNYDDNVYEFTQGGGAINSGTVSLLMRLGQLDRAVIKNRHDETGKKKTFVTEKGKKYILNERESVIARALEESRFFASLKSMNNGRQLINANHYPYIEHKKNGVETWRQPVPANIFMRMITEDLIKAKNDKFTLTKKGKMVADMLDTKYGKIYIDAIDSIPTINTNQLNGSRKIDMKKENSTLNYTLSDKQKFILYCLENGIKLNITKNSGDSQPIVKTEGEKYTFIPTPDFVALVESDFSSEFDTQKLLSHFTNQRGRINLSDLSILVYKRLVTIPDVPEPRQQGLGHEKNREISLSVVGKTFVKDMTFNGLNNPDLKRENQHGFGMTR